MNQPDVSLARPPEIRAAAWIVLDTNVVFDWLVFANAACVPLSDAIQSGRVCWVATPAMREEHFHVVGRGALDAWHPDLGKLHNAWDTHCTLVDEVPIIGEASRIRCSDEDDQKFIELALGHPARWLLSKDRAVLKLARRVRRFGPEVLTPAMWGTGAKAAYSAKAYRDRGRSWLTGTLPHHPTCGSAPGGSRS